MIEEAKVVVMVNGCFWHGCELHSRKTKSNTKWWSDKIEQNKRRDAETKALWEESGWDVVIFWEHEDPEDVARHLDEVLSARRSALQPAERKPRIAGD